MNSPASAGPTPTNQLNLLATLNSPAGVGTRTWSSAPFPSSSPSTPLLATASSDKSVSIWSLRDFRLLSTINGGHKRSVRCVGWKDWGSNKRKRDADDSAGTTNSVILATGSFDANVGVWVHNAEYSSQLVRGDDTLTTETSSHLPNGVELDNPNANAKAEDEEWHFSTLLTGPDSEIKSLTFSPPHYGANLLATSSRDKSVWIWEEVEPDEWETIAVLQEHTGDVKCVAWNAGARIRSTTDAEDDEEAIVGGREILASASYDDTIRLWRDVEEEGDWVCVGVLEGHQGTVWCISWETHMSRAVEKSQQKTWQARLASCSDDLTIRIWRRVQSEAERQQSQLNESTPAPQRLPSILRPASSTEIWQQESSLPTPHVRSIYAIDWSSHTGLLVSCGGDGIIAVYKEVQNDQGDTVMNGTVEAENQTREPRLDSKWVIVALMEAAHEEFEINHICWALRRDPGKKFDGEEVIVSTGDDGAVRVWTLPENILD